MANRYNLCIKINGAGVPVQNLFDRGPDCVLSGWNPHMKSDQAPGINIFAALSGRFVNQARHNLVIAFKSGEVSRDGFYGTTHITL